MEEWRIGPERGQGFEQQCPVALLPEHRRGKGLDRAVLVQEPRRRDRADPRNARIAVGRVADEREEVGDQLGLHAEFLAHPCRIANRFPLAVDLHDAIATHALGQVLVGRPDADFLHPLIPGGDLRRRRQGVVGFQLDHGPYHHSHRRERFLERLELREQRGLDALPGLVVGPEVVAERLDDVIGRHTDVSRSGLDHLQYRMQHAADGAEALILALAEMAPAVKLAEQLVRTVDEMNDHAAASGRRSRSGLRQPAHSRRR